MRIQFPGPSASSGPVGKLFAALVGAVLLVLGLMFSVVFIAIAVVVGLAVWAWLWWKTRALRRTLREQQASSARAADRTEGTIIEGEAIVVHDEPAGNGKSLPRH